MKQFIYILLALAGSPITFANPIIDNELSSQIMQFYPDVSENSGCRVMKKRPENNICIADIITRDFSNKGDYLYLVVLGNSEYDDCHVCTGLIDLYAFKRKTGLVLKASSKHNQLGSWGRAPTPDDVQFVQQKKQKKQKSNKVIISISTSFVQGGNVSIDTYQFYVSGSQFKSKVKSEYYEVPEDLNLNLK